jgi:hypothetical protein
MHTIKLCYKIFIVILGLLVMAPQSSIGYAQELPPTRGFFDSLNVSLKSNWPFSWAVKVESDSLRKLAFLGCGGGVFILDISDSTNPQVISDKIGTKDRIMECYYSYDDQRLYIAARYDGLHAWDIADPANPSKILSYETRGPAYGVFAQGDYVYVACEDSGLSIVDISLPNPSEIGYLPARTWTFTVEVVGNYAYLGEAFGGVFRVVNVSDPGSPYEVGYCYPGGGIVYDLEVVGHYAFLANEFDGLKVVDFADSTNPVVVDSLPTLGLTMGIAISSNGAYAYTAERGGGVQVVNISDPTNIYQEGVCSLSNPVFDVSSSGRIVSGAADVFVIVNVSSPSNPYLVASNDHPPGNHQVIKSQGDYLYIGTQGSLRILDIGDITNPTEVGTYSLPQRQTNLKGLDIAGNYAFIGRGDGVFQILDISDPASPQPLGSCNLSGDIQDLVVEGDYAYVTSDLLFLVNVSNVSAPTLVSTYDPGGPGLLLGIEVVGNYAHIANDLQGLFIVDVSDPFNPSFVSQLNPPGGFSQDLDVYGDFCYVAEGEAGVAIIDITDLTNPFLVAIHDTDDAYDVVYKQGNVYVADAFGGVKMVSVTDPANPIEIGYYDNPYSDVELAWSMTLNDNYPACFFVVHYRNGMHIYENLLYAVEEGKTAKDIIQQKTVTVFPNPAREKIMFYINPVKGTEFLKIFDSAGRLIRKLTIPGTQTQNAAVIWNGKDDKGNDVQSGVYFGKSNNDTVKFLFIK